VYTNEEKKVPDNLEIIKELAADLIEYKVRISELEKKVGDKPDIAKTRQAFYEEFMARRKETKKEAL